MPADAIVGLGTVVVDHLVVLPDSPDADAKTNVLEDRFQVGGPVPTALALLRRLGWQCSFIGTWADDPFGHMIEQDFTREGLDFTASADRRAARTGFAHVWVSQETGARSVACHRPTEGIAPSPLIERALHRARLLHLDGWPADLALHAATTVRKRGGTVVLDTGSPKPDIHRLIRCAYVVNCPERFIHQFFETDDLQRGARALLDMGPTLVTITRGNQGAMLATSDNVIHRPAFSVHAADTTGAGDVFCGALIHSLLSGWPPEEMLDFAMAAGAAKCRAIGNRDALPTERDVRHLIAAAPTGQPLTTAATVA